MLCALAECNPAISAPSTISALVAQDHESPALIPFLLRIRVIISWIMAERLRLSPQKFPHPLKKAQWTWLGLIRQRNMIPVNAGRNAEHLPHEFRFHPNRFGVPRLRGPDRLKGGTPNQVRRFPFRGMRQQQLHTTFNAAITGSLAARIAGRRLPRIPTMTAKTIPLPASNGVMRN